MDRSSDSSSPRAEPAVTGDFSLRAATTADIPVLAGIWHRGWHEAHAHLLPPALTAHRTLPSFVERLGPMLPDLTVAVIREQPVGFCAIEHDELYQLFVDPAGRGWWLAAALVRDAEERLAARGVRVGWLACAIGNDRAGRFYEKCGWNRVGTMINPAVTPNGPWPLETWRYEKVLDPRPASPHPTD